MTLQQLTYFLAAIEHGSFSAAAESLHIAQPSLSEQIRRLENELGVALFVRAGRRLALTEAGRQLRPGAEQTLVAAEEARESVAAIRGIAGGVASFGLFGRPPATLVVGLVAEFRARYPDVRVRVVGLHSSEVADAVRAGELEAALVVLPIDDAGLDVRIAMRAEVEFLSANPEQLREPITMERLCASPLILYDARFRNADPTRRQLRERAQREGLTIEPLIEVEDFDAALDLAAQGVGDTVVAQSLYSARALPPGLGAVPFADPIYDTVAFITRRGARLSPATRELIAIAEDRIEALRAL